MSSTRQNNNTSGFIRSLLVGSLVVFLAAWLIPNLPWRPKRIEDYLTIYRMVFEAFRTWSMVSTATSMIVILSYFAITGAYNWRRQYTKSTRDQKAEQEEVGDSENERIWSEIRSMKKGDRKQEDRKILPNEMKEFLEGIKVFEYLEGVALKQVLKGAELREVKKNEVIKLCKTDLAFVTFGSFTATFRDAESKANGLTVTCTRGKTLTSYSNVMRAFASFYNNIEDSDTKSSISCVALEDSQALVLDRECFEGLARLSKLSVAHLTQVILSRFKRAAIPIIFDYLNLSEFASSFLGYFIKKSQGFNDVKLAELLDTFQEPFKTDERLLKVVFQYLLGSFELDHVPFIPMESSLALLQSHIQIVRIADDQNTTIQEIGGECKGAFLVLEGKLKVSFTEAPESKFIEASVGDFVGIISSLMGKCSSIQVTSNNATYAVVSQHLLEMISERDPKILFANIPDNRNTSKFIEFLDMCIDWRQLSCGESVDVGGCVVKVLHGRVRQFKDLSDQRPLRELGSGSFLGERGIFKADSGETKGSGFFTVRQTEIASFPVDLIEGLVTVNSQVASVLLPKLLSASKESSVVDPIKTICLLPLGVDFRSKSTGAAASNSLNNVIRDNQVRLTEDVAEYLQRALKRHSTTFTVIDGSRASELMGRQLFTTLGTLKMNEFLCSQEDVSKLIIYVADGIFSNWTRQCISQADLVLLVADLEEDAVVSFGDLERQMLQMNPLINAELCLISDVNKGRDDSSRKWLKNRPWIKAHHHLSIPGHVGHVRGGGNHHHTMRNLHSLLGNRNILNMMPMDLFNNLLRKSRDLLNPRGTTVNSRIFMAAEGREDEIEVLGFGRLGRRILGRSLGLVLGGGGARGLAHLGIFKAFKEAGIQVDLIGGTSIGAFIGGLLAKEGLHNYQKILQAVEQFCRAMSSKWRQALDLTYPATSWFTGHAFNRALWKHFGFAGIEDFSVPFFAVTTDLTRSRLQVHRTGPAWKYVRASMSLSGFLPPVCDARDGTLLVDGGYLANVPIELMLQGSLTELSSLQVSNDFSEEGRDALAASMVIAIDVGRASDRVPIYYGDSLNGWTVIFKKILMYFCGNLNNKSAKINKNNALPLTLDEIQFRLAYASSAGLLSRTLKRGHVQLASELSYSHFVTVNSNQDHDNDANPLPEIMYLRPKGVQQYSTLEFQKCDEIIRVGYEFGLAVLEEWRENGLLQGILKFQGNVNTNNTVTTAPTAANTAGDSEICVNNARCRRSSI